jgi:group II intron reverse transcriptase/maturase
MGLEDARHQKPASVGLAEGGRGEAPRALGSDEASTASHGTERSGSDRLLEQVVEASNAREAWKRVVRNQGGPGLDGMRVEDLAPYLAANWERIRSELLAGTYQPQPVLRREIEKSGGGVRVLGIPCVLDRFIQQAILQVLQPRFDPTFSTHSYGFRPGRSAHDAIRAAQRFVEEGRHWVVDCDLESFFDRVHHDVLMSRLAKRIEDKRLLGLIRRYLEAGMMAHGVAIERHEGTPQGGPLSPLLSNVLLDEVDRELEKRGHAFCRYGDDCNVYVRSERAGKRVMGQLRKLYARLRLKVNEEKSAVAPAWDRKFLGFRFRRTRNGKVKRCVAPESLDKMKKRVREITARNGGRSMRSVVSALRSYLTGWKAYFRLTEVRSQLHGLDAWVRRRLRILQLKQWKRGRTAFPELCARGLDRVPAARIAARCRRYVWASRQPALFIALPDKHFDAMGVPRLAR